MRFLIASFSVIALSCLMTQRQQLLPEASGVILSGRNPVADAKVWHERGRTAPTGEDACSNPPPDETSITDANGRFKLAGRKGSKVLVSSWGDAIYGWGFCLQTAAGRTFASSVGGFIGPPQAGAPSRVIYFCELTINELRCVTSEPSSGPLSFWRSKPRTYHFSDCESAAVDYCDHESRTPQNQRGMDGYSEEKAKINIHPNDSPTRLAAPGQERYLSRVPAGVGLAP